MSTSAALKATPMPNFDISAVVTANANATSGKADITWLQPFQAATSSAGNEMIFFVKPEVAAEKGVKMADCLALIDSSFTKFGLTVEAAAVLGAGYLKANNIMGSHYGVINQISNQGRKALAGDTAKKFDDMFAAELAAGAKVMGGHEFLTHYSYFTAESLGVLWDALNSTSRKIAPGTYGMVVNVLNDKVIILNGFHPYQLLHFNNPGRSIIMMKVRSNASWKDLRDNLIGETDVTKANPGSIRAEFLAKQAALAIPSVNKGNNGVHLSAGPVEGMFEIIRFCSDYAGNKMLTPAQTSMGQLLKAAGFSDAKIMALGSNPLIKTADKAISAFDLTEMMEPQQAADLLKTYIDQI